MTFNWAIADEWVMRACAEIPVGKCILLPKPENMPIEHFMNQLRCMLNQSKKTTLDKWSVRRSKHEDYAVIMKSGTWIDQRINSLLAIENVGS